MRDAEFKVEVLRLLDVIANAARRTAEACERAEAWAPREELPSPLAELAAPTEKFESADLGDAGRVEVPARRVRKGRRGA